MRPSPKETMKSLKAAHQAFRTKVLTAMSDLKYPATRQIASVSATDDSGKLNGMTIVELITMVQMAELNSERVVLEASQLHKTLYIKLEKKPTVIISTL